MNFAHSVDQLAVFDVLRYICLYSLTSNGLPQYALDYVKREIYQKYGFRFFVVFEELEALGTPLPHPNCLPRNAKATSGANGAMAHSV